MSEQSAIEWTDATWNPVRGCTKVSPGCAHCYAETFSERFRGVPGHPYEQGFDLRLVPEKLTEPLRWKKPRRVFVNSMSDLFQDGVPDEYIVEVFAMMAAAHQHTFQVLTKRAERMHNLLGFYRPSGPPPFSERVIASRNRIPGHRVESLPWPLPNVWLGVSVENQHFADERIPLLLQTPSAVRFISAEPLLGPIDLRGAWRHVSSARSYVPRHELDGLDWVIVGGESGHGARPLNLAWARSIVVQCKVAGVPVFMKQLGALAVEASEILNLTSKKGGDPSEWPADLRIREFPRAC